MENYISEIKKYFSDPMSTEMSYRTPFQNYLESIFKRSDGYIVQHDQRVVNGNKPDFVVKKGDVYVLYIEVKTVEGDLNKTEKSGQANRYFGYDNLIISDYINFRFYRHGQKYGEEISLGQIDKKDLSIEIKDNSHSINILSHTILDFVSTHKEPIKSGGQLARIMGGKAERIRSNVIDMLIKNKNGVDDKNKFGDIVKIQKVVEQSLVSDLTDDKFADMYAQTLVYGLFAARYSDKSIDTFSRVEARDLVPKTNPFLASFFDHIAGASFPDRLRYIVDELCEVFTHADVHKLLHDFYGKEKDNKDPVIHFYEDFLQEYDAKKKMEMGVFYTPKPVVDFIVRSVDEILKNEFGIVKGLSDNSKIKVQKEEINDKGKMIKVDKEYHKVQILDVATGTGTFLNETILHIYKSFKGQEGRWESYVKSDLLPRLHGFELMMASYTIAHLKLGMTLADTGVVNLDERLGVYLTNTLDPAGDTSIHTSLFTQLGVQDAISTESLLASKVKSEFPIMCVIGNPPYAISSNNKGDYITDLIKVYKENMNERNIQPLSDDYIKFIRFAENLIYKNKEGIVAMITNNSFVDGIIHRQMRKHLLETFDKIYILDLHGNARKVEKNIDGGIDQNVFDIMQGVSINIFIKTNKKNENKLADVYSYDLQGVRNSKYNFLDTNSLKSIKWNKLNYSEPYYFFTKKEFLSDTENLFKIKDLFIKSTMGIATGKDCDLVSFDIKSIENKFNKSCSKFYYHPFDIRYTIFDNSLLQRSRMILMDNYINKDNLGLNVVRQSKNKGLEILISNIISNRDLITNHTYNFPLYLYTDQNEKVPNLNKDIWNKINEIVFDSETSPEDILDYIYASLHSPAYREKYKEFLKIDFPRVPYPESSEEFWRLVKIGQKLRALHLMLDPDVNNLITQFPVTGDNIVNKVRCDKVKYDKVKCDNDVSNDNNDDISNGICNVYINDEQYFGGVPQVAWDFYIGGYQPSQKYLKDRKGRVLSNDEIEHYQKIIKVLAETDRMMKSI